MRYFYETYWYVQSAAIASGAVETSFANRLQPALELASRGDRPIPAIRSGSLGDVWQKPGSSTGEYRPGGSGGRRKGRFLPGTFEGRQRQPRRLSVFNGYL